MKDELSTSNEQLLTIDAVVLANGEYPASPLPLKILAEAPYVVCCDGGADEYIRRGHTPDVIIGDGDSLSDENRRKFGHILHRISDQETNDQTKAVNFLLAQGKRRIAIIGATGKREDHTLGNISLLIDYLRAEPMYVPIPITASSSPAGVPAPSQAIPDSKYPSSTSMPVKCMDSAWYTLSATSPTGGKALSTNASEQSLRLRRKGSIWFF